MPPNAAVQGSEWFARVPSGGRAAALVLPVTRGSIRPFRLIGPPVVENTRPDTSPRRAPEGFAMRPSSNPSIALSTLDPLDIKLPEGTRAQIVCPVCGTFQEVKRGLVRTHHPIEGKPACAGSRQHLIFDVSPAQWAEAHRAAIVAQRRIRAAVHAKALRADEIATVSASRHAIDQRVRRATAVHSLRYPPVAPPVHRIAALKAAA